MSRAGRSSWPLLLALVAAVPATAASGVEGTLTVFFTSEIRGNLRPCG